MDESLRYIHPEFVRRAERLVAWCWEHSWSMGWSSTSRSEEQQREWYRLWKMVPPQWPNMVADPDAILGPFPAEVGEFYPQRSVAGLVAFGSMHEIQQDGWAHALDVWWIGPKTQDVHNRAIELGLLFLEPTEVWHLQWWDPVRGVYPVLDPEDDMTLDEYMRGTGRLGEDQGCLKMIDGVIHQKLSDQQWYTLADRDEFIHRHMKHMDEGGA